MAFQHRKGSVSALHAACISGRLNDVTSYLDQDVGGALLAAINEEDSGNTALHYACAAGFLDVVRFLLKRGAPLNKQNDEGWTPLMQACYAGHSDIVSALIQSQADINVVNRCNCTALTLACYSGNERIVRSLIESGAQFSHSEDPNESYLNPMIAACVRGNIDALKELMNAFHSVALRRKDCYNGQTPLSISAIFNWTQLVETLLKEGADTNTVDVNNRTAYDLAAMCKSKQCKGILKSKTFTQNASMPVQEVQPIEHPIIEMAKQGNLKSLREALENDPNLINARNTEDGATVLMYACVAGHLSIVKLLVSKGANLDERDVLSGWTALMQATYHHNAEIVKFLIESGADASIRSHQNISAFDIASFMDNVDTDIVVLLASKMKTTAGSNPGSATLDRPGNYDLGADHLRPNQRTNSTPIINRLKSQTDEDQISNGNLKSGNSGSVKNLWNKFTGKLRDLKIARPDINRVSAMPVADMDQSNFGPRVGGWISIHDQLASSETHFSPEDSAIDSGIFSTPSAYSIQIEPIHVQTAKQLAPVLPPFKAVPSSMESSKNMQLSRHKSSFTKRYDRRSGYHRQHKPIKANPPKFLQTKKSSATTNPNNSGSSNTNANLVKFEASEHSLTPHAIPGDPIPNRNAEALLSRVNQSLFHKPHFGQSQHVASPQPAPIQSTSGGFQQSSSLTANLSSSKNLEIKSSGLGHSRIGSFGSSISSGDYSWSQNSNLNPNFRNNLPSKPPSANDASLGSSPVMNNIRNMAMGSGHWSSPRAGSGTGGSSSLGDGRMSFDSSANTADDVMNSQRLLNTSTSSRQNSKIGAGVTSATEMTQILSELALMKYKHIFDQQEVDREVLLSLTEDDLDEMGIGQQTSQQQILSAINVYKNQGASSKPNNQSSNNTNNNKSNLKTNSSNKVKTNQFLTVQKPSQNYKLKSKASEVANVKGQ